MLDGVWALVIDSGSCSGVLKCERVLDPGLDGILCGMEDLLNRDMSKLGFIISDIVGSPSAQRISAASVLTFASEGLRFTCDLRIGLDLATSPIRRRFSGLSGLVYVVLIAPRAT